MVNRRQVFHLNDFCAAVLWDQLRKFAPLRLLVKGKFLNFHGSLLTWLNVPLLAQFMKNFCIFETHGSGVFSLKSCAELSVRRNTPGLVFVLTITIELELVELAVTA